MNWYEPMAQINWRDSVLIVVWMEDDIGSIVSDVVVDKSGHIRSDIWGYDCSGQDPLSGSWHWPESVYNGQITIFDLL